MTENHQYSLFTLELMLEEEAAGHSVVEDAVRFFGPENGDGDRETIAVPAFRRQGRRYGAHFLPRRRGLWAYETITGERGEFLCTDPLPESHGKVVTEGDHFSFEDGSRYLPFGTTCYAWIYQPAQRQEETIETLRNHCFNKLRMLVFPKFMPYNEEEPEMFPFRRREDGSWDVEEIEPAFWDNLEKRIAQLNGIGVQADLILFHPYDRWGFARMSREECLAYLSYCVARFAAYPNIWWSLANEYEMLTEKTEEDWDTFGSFLRARDPYGSLISIHNILIPYPKRDWMSHVSVQSGDIDRIPLWKRQYQLPVIDDELGYEGDLEYDWGNLSAFEEVQRTWRAVTRGGFATHGETFYREDQVLWWSKGGKLYGRSPERIAFLKDLLYSLPGEMHSRGVSPLMDPNGGEAAEEEENRDAFARLLERTPEENKGGLLSMEPMILYSDDWYLRFFGNTCPCCMRTDFSDDGMFKAWIIDIWEMTMTPVEGPVRGKQRVSLPARPGMAVLFRKEN